MLQVPAWNVHILELCLIFEQLLKCCMMQEVVSQMKGEFSTLWNGVINELIFSLPNAETAMFKL